VQFGTMFRVTGSDLVLRHKGRRDVPPLIVVAAFEVWTPLPRLFGSPRVVERVEIDGLEFNIPPRYSDEEARFPNQTPPSEKPEEAPAPTSAPKPEVVAGPAREPGPARLVISQLVARDARLAIIPKEGWKPPKVWAIRTLSMSDLAPDRPM